MPTIFFLITYCIWYFITVIYQFDNSLIKKLKQGDIFQLIPTWKFFAPDPIKSDFYLLYRDRIEERIYPFNEVNLYNERFFLRVIFNPNYRINKTFLSFARDFANVDHLKSYDSMLISLQYITILTLVNKYTFEPNSQRQFVILQSDGVTSELKLIIASEFHKNG